MARAAVAIAIAGVLATTSFDAQARLRRRFDPEDLKIEDTGVVHADLSFGVVRGEEAGRWLVPDFDVDVGLSPNVELGIDGAWSVEGTPNDLYAFDHRAPDNLWFSSKFGIFDSKDDDDATAAWAFGAQMGPRVAVAPDARGAGFQALALLGRNFKRTHFVLNLGGLVDPGAGISYGRPTAVLTGIDAVFDLDAKAKWSIAADLSGVVFLSHEKHQLISTAQLVCAVTPWLDVSAGGLVGFFAGGDRYGVLINFAPKLAVF